MKTGKEEGISPRHLVPTQQGVGTLAPNDLRGVAIFAKACFGHPSPSKQQKLNATANAFVGPVVLSESER
jgi:hypothetical protein